MSEGVVSWLEWSWWIPKGNWTCTVNIQRTVRLPSLFSKKPSSEGSLWRGEAEEVAYGKFTYWCSTSIAELKKTIADETELIEELTDKIEGKTKEKETLEKDIGKLEDLMGELEKAQTASDKKRKKANGLYKAALSDTQLTIKAMEDAIAALEGAEGKTEPGALIAARKQIKQIVALLAVKASETQMSRLQSFVGGPEYGPDFKAKGDLAAHTDKYDFKSENVIELLKELKLKFEDDETELTTEETNSVNSYELEKDARDNEHTAAKKSKDAKNDTLKEVKQALIDAKALKKDTEDDKEADEKTLEATESQCETKKTEWEARSKTRSLEIEAMEAAIGILAKSTGVRTEAPDNPIPPAAPVLLQLLSVNDASNIPMQKAYALIKEVAEKYNSQALIRLAVQVQAHQNQTPGKGAFDQVINMIEKMIFRLMDEQKSEDEHKLWCDQEIKKTNAMITDKTDKSDELEAEIGVQNGKIGALTDDIADAAKMIADITKFEKEATEIREIGKKENALAIADADKAQKSLADAIAVLTEFYKSSGQIPKEPWESLIQGRATAPVKLPENPATWDSGYTGVADPVNPEGGIIAILEKVMEDFATMEADTHAQEASDEAAYKKSMSEMDIEKSRRTQEEKMKTEEKARRVEKVSDLTASNKNVEAELEKTNQYMTDLQPACVEGDSSYDKRKAARTKEIEALHKAQDILHTAFDGSSRRFLQVKSDRKALSL